MIGNEKISPDLKFVEVFRRLARIDAALAEIEEALAARDEPRVPNGRRVLTLNKGER